MTRPATTRPEPSDEGGSGGTPSRNERRQHLRILESMVYDGWQMPEGMFASVPAALHEIATCPTQSTRDRIRAMEALSHLAQQSVEAAIALDRINRLDSGQATDRVQVLDGISDAQLRAVAQTIAAVPKPTDAKPKHKPRRSRQSRP